jgi:hypothetical protein
MDETEIFVPLTPQLRTCVGGAAPLNVCAKNGPEQVQNGDTFTNATDYLLDYLFGLERAATTA